MKLAEAADLRGPADEHLSVPTDKGANGAKITCLVASMVAGADPPSNDMACCARRNRETVRHDLCAVTLGSFLRKVTSGHVRQLDAVASRNPTALAGLGWLLCNLDHTPVHTDMRCFMLMTPSLKSTDTRSGAQCSATPKYAAPSGHSAIAIHHGVSSASGRDGPAPPGFTDADVKRVGFLVAEVPKPQKRQKAQKDLAAKIGAVDEGRSYDMDGSVAHGPRGKGSGLAFAGSARTAEFVGQISKAFADTPPLVGGPAVGKALIGSGSVTAGFSG